jgi:non-ribosomal peptide synthase protein (TIGR01720 family)
VEGHGRDGALEQLDLSRTVGWFTTIFPVHLALPEQELPDGETVQTLVRQLRRTPHRGHGYGLLRYLSADLALRARLAAVPRADILFNYVGQVDLGVEGYAAWFRGLRSLELSRSEAARRPYPLELDVRIEAGQLSMRWTYSRHLQSRQAVERLARACAQALEGFAPNGSNLEPTRFTPADFPAARLDQNDLDLFLRRFG